MLKSICICSKAHVSFITFKCIFYKEKSNNYFCLRREFLKAQIIFCVSLKSDGRENTPSKVC